MMQAVVFFVEDGTPVLRCADGADASEVAEWAARVRRGGFGGVLEIRLAGPWTGDGREWEIERGRLAAAGVSVRAVAMGDLSGMAAVAFVQASERVMAQGSSVRLGGGGAGFTDAGGVSARMRAVCDGLDAGWSDALASGARVEAEAAAAAGVAELLNGATDGGAVDADALRIPEWGALIRDGAVAKADLCRHAMAFGEPGSGKSAGVIGPVIEAAVREGAGVGCLLVVDPKDEHGHRMPDAVTIDARAPEGLATVRVDAGPVADWVAEGRVMEAARALIVAGAGIHPGSSGAVLGGESPRSTRDPYWEVEGARFAQTAVAFTLSLLQAVESAFPGFGEGWRYFSGLRREANNPGRTDEMTLLLDVAPLLAAAGYGLVPALIELAVSVGDVDWTDMRRITGDGTVDLMLVAFRERLARPLHGRLRAAEERLGWLVGALERHWAGEALFGDAGDIDPGADPETLAWRRDAVSAMEPEVVRATGDALERFGDLGADQLRLPSEFGVLLLTAARAELFRLFFSLRTGPSENILALSARAASDAFMDTGQSGLVPASQMFNDWGWPMLGVGARRPLTGDEARWRQGVTGLYSGIASSGEGRRTSGHYVGLVGVGSQCLAPFLDAGRHLSFGVEPGSADGVLDFDAAADAPAGSGLRAWRLVGGLLPNGWGRLYARAVKAAYFGALLRSDRRGRAGIAGSDLALYVADEFQRFVTSGDGHGEAQFLDVCRSRGVACVLATQSVSGLELALDQHGGAASSLLALAATKFFFRTSDAATLAHLSALAPPSLGGASAAACRPAGQLACGECHAALANGRTACRMIDLDAAVGVGVHV